MQSQKKKKLLLHTVSNSLNKNIIEVIEKLVNGKKITLKKKCFNKEITNNTSIVYNPNNNELNLFIKNSLFNYKNFINLKKKMYLLIHFQ